MTTIEEIVDLGDGRKKVIRTTRQESIEEDESACATPPAQRNMFRKLRIVCGSAGEFGGTGSSSDTTPQTFFFRDFDDLVDRIDQARLKKEEVATNTEKTEHGLFTS